MRKATQNVVKITSGTECLRNHGKAVYARGLCQSCYAVAAGLVKRGKTTWADLEKKGKVLPSQRAFGMTTVDWFLS